MHEGLIQLQIALHPFRQRIRLLLIERYACWGAAIAGLLALFLIILDHLTRWYITSEGLLGLALLGAMIGAVMALVRPLSPMAVAATIEQRHNLKERASTTLALHADAHADPAFRDAITADALTALGDITPRALFAPQWARRHALAGGAWMVAIILFLLPVIPWFQSPAAEVERLAMREAGKTLQEQAKQMRQDPQMEHNNTAKQVIRNMQKLGVELEKQRLPRREAMVRMHQLEEQLTKLDQSLAKQEREAVKPAADAARKAAEAAKQAAAKNGKTAAQAKARAQQLEKVASSLQAGDMPSAMAELQQLGEDLQTAELTPEEQQSLAKALQQMAKAAPKTSAANQAKQLQQAANALSKCNKPGQCKGGQCMAKLGKPGNCNGRKCAGRKAAVANARAGMSGNCKNGGMCNNPGGTPGTGRGTGPGMVNTANRPTPREPGAGFDAMRQQAQLDKNAPIYAIDTKGAPDAADRTKVPYYEVYPAYKKSAEHAMRSEDIPLAERQRVKDYFDALDPASQGARGE